MNRVRLRRRLTIAFVLVAALAAAAVAVSSYLLVRQAWLDDSLRRADRDARYQLALAEQFLPLDAERGQRLLDSFAGNGRDVVLVAGGAAVPSNPATDPPLPQSLRAAVADGQLAYHRLAGEDRLLVVGGRIGGSPDQLYVTYVERPIYTNLEQLRSVLLAGTLAVTLVAGAVGYGLARRTLEPVGRAAAAARAVAAGRLHTRLPEGRDEFGAWAASFNEMADALQAKLTALSLARQRERRFTADVAHELRTPVTALVAEASLLREQLESLPPDARRPAELLLADVVRLRHLVAELLEISRLEGGQERVRDEQVDLAALVGAVVAGGGWSDRVRVDVPATVVRTDRHRVERVLTNLVANAIDHGGDGVAVRATLAGGDAGRDGAGVDGVRTGRAGVDGARTGRAGVDGARAGAAGGGGGGGGGAGVDGIVVVEVCDRGPGIAPEHLPHVFDRFYKVDRARSSGGSGLGLAIARENARLLGGTLSVASRVGQGTTFRFTLPVTRLLPDGEATVRRAADA